MPKKAGPLQQKELTPTLRLPREPQKRADRHDAYRCRLFGRFRDRYSYRYRGPRITVYFATLGFDELSIRKRTFAQRRIFILATLFFLFDRPWMP